MKALLTIVLIFCIPYTFSCKSESWSAPQKSPEKELVLSLGYSEATACGTNNGTIILAAEGGSGHYKFHSQEYGENHSGLFNHLSAGNHLFILSDEHGNFDSLEVLIGNEDGIVIESVSINNPEPGQDNGSFRLKIQGGKPPYLYKIDGGLLQSSKVFKELKSGSYQVTAMDSKGCTFTRYVELKEEKQISA